MSIATEKHWDALEEYRQKADHYLKPKEKAALLAAIDILMDQSVRDLAQDCGLDNQTPETTTSDGSDIVAALILLPYALIRLLLAKAGLLPLPSPEPAPASPSEAPSLPEEPRGFSPEHLRALTVLYARSQCVMTRREQSAMEAVLRTLQAEGVRDE